MSKDCAFVVFVLVLSSVTAVSADIFGTGGNQFTIDFVTISGDTNPTTGIEAGFGFIFTGVNHDYRMGVYDITNDQWNKFKAELGVPVTGSPAYAYGNDPEFTGANVPVNMVSWYEAAQFVNWLNTSAGHQAAYKFTGTQGTENYVLEAWSPAETADGSRYRHKDAFYFLPTDNEWVKAAYWNGTTLQNYATQSGAAPHGGAGTGWNFWDNGPAANPYAPWAVGSGAEELNGTYDMMGNVWEWLESPYHPSYQDPDHLRAKRGGGYTHLASDLRYTARSSDEPTWVHGAIGFRVASKVPEPATLGLLALGGLALLKRRR